MSRDAHAHAPMPLAEAAECCGQLHWNGIALEQRGTNFTDACVNCPLLIARDERHELRDALRAARAL